MTKKKRWPLVLCLLTGLGAAGCTSEEEEQANSRAKEFAEDYFNLRFDEAYGNCTEDSRKWIAFRASNITEHDLEAVRSAPEGAYISSTECQQINDSTALVASFAKHLPPIRWNSKEGASFRRPHISSLYGRKAAGGLSEWKAHCKMQSKIPLKVRMNNRIMVTDIIIRRMNGFHTSVQT